MLRSVSLFSVSLSLSSSACALGVAPLDLYLSFDARCCRCGGDSEREEKVAAALRFLSVAFLFFLSLSHPTRSLFHVIL